jgi:hypothetical protein
MKKKFFRRKLEIDILDLAKYYNGDMSKAIDDLLELAENSSSYKIYSKYLNSWFKGERLFRYGKSFDYRHDKSYGLIINNNYFSSYDYLIKRTEKVIFTFFNVYFDDNIIETVSDVSKYNI